MRRRESQAEQIALLAGRVILGGFFLYNGVNHFKQLKSMAQYAGSKKVPLPTVAVAGSGKMLLAGGASLVTGFHPKIGLGLIAAFLAGVSPVMHDFWRQSDPNQRMNEMINFSKNMALLGATLALMAHPEPWPMSLEI
jgi:putative oxidoreductase